MKEPPRTGLPGAPVYKMTAIFGATLGVPIDAIMLVLPLVVRRRRGHAQQGGPLRIELWVLVFGTLPTVNPM